jgi:hypothetical protein
MLVLGATTTPTVAFLVWPLWEGSAQLAILNGITYRQQTIPDELLGRVNVVGRMVAWGGQPFGAALGGTLATVADIRTAVFVMVVPVGVAAVASAAALRSGDA